MKRVFILILTCGVVVMMSAEESDKGSHLKIDNSIQASLSIKNQFISVNNSAAYRFGFLGVGGGVKTFFGLSLPENRIAPYARLELGRFYLGLGPAFPAPQARVEEGYASVGASFLATAGLAPTFVQLGPGRLGLDASVDFLPTSHEAVQVDVSTDQGLLAAIIGGIVANVAANVAVFVVNTTKLSIGATYSISL